jgi:alkaline phosphatase
LLNFLSDLIIILNLIHTEKMDYKFPSLVALEYETHASEDVPIYARGPYSHLLVGTIEQNVIPHIIAYASCIGNNLKACKEDNNSG